MRNERWTSSKELSAAAPGAGHHFRLQPALEDRLCLLQCRLDFCYSSGRFRVVVRDIGQGGTPFRQICDRENALVDDSKVFVQFNFLL
jgi:hypothetical protein